MHKTYQQCLSLGNEEMPRYNYGENKMPRFFTGVKTLKKKEKNLFKMFLLVLIVKTKLSSHIDLPI